MGDKNLEYFIAEWKMIPDTGGKFEVEVNGELLFSKKQLGRHAEDGEIRALLQEKIDAVKQKHGITWDTIPEED